MLTCTQATHTHTNTWHSIGLPLHLKHNSTTTNLPKNKWENKKTQSHNPVYRLSRPCAGPHSWLNDDNRNKYTHTHNAGLLPPPSPPPPAQTVRVRVELTTRAFAQQAAENQWTPPTVGTQRGSVTQPSSQSPPSRTLPTAPMHRHTHGHHHGRHTEGTERDTRLDCTHGPLRGSLLWSYAVTGQGVKRWGWGWGGGEYLCSIYWIMDDSSLRLLKEGRVGERGWEKRTACSPTSRSDEAVLEVSRDAGFTQWIPRSHRNEK